MAHNALRQAKEFVTASGGEIAPLPISEEELNPTAQYDQSMPTRPLESMSACYKVGYSYPDDSACSEFCFFEDGRQRTVQIGHIRARHGSNHVMIPVHFFVVAAAILQRNGRKLKVWDCPLKREGIFVGKSLLPDQRVLEAFEESELIIIDTAEQGGDYYDLRRRALIAAKEQRLEIEQELITKWRKTQEAVESFLVVDGTLMNLRDEKNVNRCVGVSKSFGSRYFSVSDYNRILQMREFERSWTFRFHDPEDEEFDLRKGGRERVSWYLRLREGRNVDPEFGLIRIEISKEYIDQAAEFANRFSRWLLSERLPTSYPSPRWDKHLFPIAECENYLSSFMPSIATINASMKG